MKIVVPCLHRFGDMILMTAFFKSIKINYPTSILTVISGAKNKIILNNNPDIDRILVFDKNPYNFIKLLSNYKEKYDYYIDTKDHYSSESHFLAKLFRANTKIGFNLNNINTFNISIPSDKDNLNLHFVERNNLILNLLPIKGHKYFNLPCLYPDIKSEKKINEFIYKINRNYKILINISAGKNERQLNINQINKLIKILSNYGKIIILYERTDKLLAENLNKAKENLMFYGSKNFTDIISLVKNCDLIVSPDTSIVHISSAFDKPLIAFYLNIEWNFNKFYPLNTKKLIIKTKSELDDLSSIDINYYKNDIDKFINNTL